MKRFPSEVILGSKDVAQGLYPFEMGLEIVTYFGIEGAELRNKGRDEKTRVKVLADGCREDCVWCCTGK